MSTTSKADTMTAMTENEFRSRRTKRRNVAPSRPAVSIPLKSIALSRTDIGDHLILLHMQQRTDPGKEAIRNGRWGRLIIRVV